MTLVFRHGLLWITSSRLAIPMQGQPASTGRGNGGIMRLAPIVICYGSELDQARRFAQAQSKTTHASATCMHYAAALAEILFRGDARAVPTPSDPPDAATGYVVHTFEAACWAVSSTRSFRDAILAAVNLGGDADTVGAVTGQIAGAIYGYDAISEDWCSRLWWHDKILERADHLWALSPGTTGASQ